MRDAAGPGTMLGYCTNVHAGESLNEVKRNLEQHALRVKEIVSPREPMGVGLWLSAATARQVIDERWAEPLRGWLAERGLKVFTLNGFPHDDFHEPVVKDRVYRPDWTTTLRCQYTLDLIEILLCLLDEGEEGSISTLPLGWPGHERWDERMLEAAAMQLINMTIPLRSEREHSGRLIHLDLEPEPGCVLQSPDDVAGFFRDYLLPVAESVKSAEAVREHIRVCHDICHAAVLFEDQAGALATYERAGIKVGKVQVSSALDLDLDALPEDRRRTALDELARFAEPRYLHQTSVLRGGPLLRGGSDSPRGGSEELFDDLPHALASRHARDAAGRWRIHFHVPIYMDRIGPLGTTRGEIGRCVRAARPHGIGHWEVETYAWPVLPEDLRPGSLAEGIARELQWFSGEATQRHSDAGPTQAGTDPEPAP